MSEHSAVTTVSELALEKMPREKEKEPQCLLNSAAQRWCPQSDLPQPGWESEEEEGDSAYLSPSTVAPSTAS